MAKMRKELPDYNKEIRQQPGYFEWRYLHLICNNGTAINAIFHQTDLFGIEKKSYRSISFLIPGQKSVHFSQHGENPELKQIQGKLRLSVPFDNEARLSGYLTQLAEPLVVNEGLLFKDSQGRTSNWVVEIPQSSFKGTLEVGGKKMEIEGFGYLDHQWGTLPVQEFVADWVWGHFSDAETSIIFFKIITREGTFIDRFGLFTNGRVKRARYFKAKYLQDLAKANSPDQIDTLGEISAPEVDEQISFLIKPKNLMRSRVGEKYDKFSASYLRWASTGIISDEERKKRLSGVTEYLRIRK